MVGNYYKGPIIKIVAKIIISAAIYGIAYRLSRKIWS
jgi:hypothetical protein